MSGPALSAPCSVPGTHATVAAAVADASCDPVTVASGEFEASVVISRDLTLQGAGPDQTTLLAGLEQTVIEIGSSAIVHLEGLKLTSPGSGSSLALAKQSGGTLTMSEVTVSSSLFGDGFETGDTQGWSATNP
jgi:hypothetical protein